MLAMIAIAENHTQDLQQASVTVQRMQESLEKGAEYAKTWSSSVIAKGPGLDWAFRVGGPIVGVMVGGYGIAARTTIQNAQLMFSGKYPHINGYLSLEIILLTSPRLCIWRERCSISTLERRMVLLLLALEHRTHNTTNLDPTSPGGARLQSRRNGRILIRTSHRHGLSSI